MRNGGHAGLDIQLEALGADVTAALFNEELGMVLQVRGADAAAIQQRAGAAGLKAAILGATSADYTLRLRHGAKELLAENVGTLHRAWAETSHRIASLRDNPDCAREEFEAIGRKEDPGLSVHLSFDPTPDSRLPTPAIGRRPKVAILREQGVNGQSEMAYAFHAAGFESVDVHMSDILEGRVDLAGFRGLAACGGFSYGDVLGAGQGWAKTILFNARGRDQFQAFLAAEDRFALGVCNGCQMFAALKELVPGAEHWPAFRRNTSEQYEARWVQLEVLESKSLFFAGMAGSRMPIAVAHGEGRAVFSQASDLGALQRGGQVAARFIDTQGQVATRYPQNPNGTPEGVTAISNADGRVTILMPHPERTIAGPTGSWWPQAWDGKTPWFRMFQNARKWVG